MNLLYFLLSGKYLPPLLLMKNNSPMAASQNSSSLANSNFLPRSQTLPRSWKTHSQKYGKPPPSGNFLPKLLLRHISSSNPWKKIPNRLLPDQPHLHYPVAASLHHPAAGRKKGILQQPDPLSSLFSCLFSFPSNNSQNDCFLIPLDTCRPQIGLQKHYSDSMMANQGLTRGCLGAWHLAKQCCSKTSPTWGSTDAYVWSWKHQCTTNETNN